MREDHCGPYWMPSFLRKIVSCPFNQACAKHDQLYASKEVSRQEADLVFFEECIIISRGRWLLEVYACVLFILVRAGGKLSWGKK